MEHPRDQVGAVCSLLARQQLTGDLIPLWVGRKRYKKARATVLAHDRHRILIALPYKAGAAKVTGRQNHPAPYRGKVDVGAREGVSDAVIEIRAEVRLVPTEPV